MAVLCRVTTGNQPHRGKEADGREEFKIYVFRRRWTKGELQEGQYD